MMNANVLFCIAVSCCLSACVAGPLHASCKIDWKFGLNCTVVHNKLVQQILKWKGDEGCAGGGEKCLYKLVSNSSAEIKATHSTPVKHYIDDLTFTFNAVSAAKCAVHGFSTSKTWYAVFDYGTNYCNLRNLMEGSGLVNATGFNETTNDSQCTQYSIRNCNKY